MKNEYIFDAQLEDTLYIKLQFLWFRMCMMCTIYYFLAHIDFFGFSKSLDRAAPFLSCLPVAMTFLTLPGKSGKIDLIEIPRQRFLA